MFQFTLDASNRQQVAAACILLFDVLTAVELQKATILIVVNKWYNSVLTFLF
jgi:hypothetical protein